ncbi:MAG: hypothetical protein ACREA3_02200 [Nitrosotalea sp.]
MVQIDKKIFDKIAKHSKISPKYANAQTIRVLISNIRTQNAGLTPNASAHIFAKKHGVSVFRHLSDDDKKSLKNYNSPPSPSSHSKPNTEYPRTRKRKLQLPFDQKLVQEAEKNMDIYPYVYILENSIRKLILDKFANKNNWWTDSKIVKQDIQDYAQKIQDAEKKHKWVGKRGAHPIYYIGLDHLYKIIEMNYNPHFKNLFEISNLKTWINECVPIRNLLAHNVPTQQSERDNIKIRTKYICNSIK